METMYVLEYTNPGPEIVDIRYKHVECSICGIWAIARVGSIGVRFARKSELTDFSDTAQGIIVRRSAINHLTEAHISGWRPGYVQVETIPRLRDLDVAYCEMVVIGHTRGYAKCVGLQVEHECKECGRRVFVYPQEGLVIPEECWDRSDIFVIDELPGIEVVTETFRQTVERYQHTGVKFVPISEWRDPLGWTKTLSASRAVQRSFGRKL